MTGLELVWLLAGAIIAVVIVLVAINLMNEEIAFFAFLVALIIIALTFLGVFQLRDTRLQAQAEHQIEELYHVEVENISVSDEWVTWLNDEGEFCTAELKKDHGRYLIVDGSTTCEGS